MSAPVTSTVRTIPVLVTFVSAAMAVVGLVFAFGFFTNPASLLKEVDTTNPAIRGLAFTLGTRSLAMALALGMALLLRSREALIAVLFMRLVTESLDLVNVVSVPHEMGVVVVIGIMIAAELAALALLLRARGHASQAAPLTGVPT